MLSLGHTLRVIPRIHAGEAVKEFGLSGFGWGNSKKVIWTNDDLSLRVAFFAAKQSHGRAAVQIASGEAPSQ